MQTREQLEIIVDSALAAACADGTLQVDEVPASALERPRDESNGDWASTVALRSARSARCNPRDLAQVIIDHLPKNDVIASAEVAGPGFINFRLTPSVLQSVIQEVRTQQNEFAKGTPKPYGPINLEYVSANPTGPMHVGHGRWAALGDTIARVMRHVGYDVSEEFYINDHGTQMDVFAASVNVRYLQLLGQDRSMADHYYGGSYVKTIAQEILDEEGNKWAKVAEDDRLSAFKEMAYQKMLASMKATLARFGNHFSCWFSERSLYEQDDEGKNAVDRALETLQEKDCIFECEGATWFRSTAYGDTKDRVLIKANGEYTYFMSDIAYHFNKLDRGFSHLINIWGADHHGYVARCKAALAAGGHADTLEVILGQLVNLLRDKTPVRMSKRTGEMVTFNELIDEVGVDATRYLMLSRSSDQPIDFDIEVAKRQDASNPVYYVQYAHARICSVLRRAVIARKKRANAKDASNNKAEETVGFTDTLNTADVFPTQLDTPEATVEPEVKLDDLARELVPLTVDLSSLTADPELALMRKMDELPELIEIAARDRAPFHLTHYAQELAGLFHQFYAECRIIGEDPAIERARLALADATRIVLALVLSLLGVSAPTKM